MESDPKMMDQPLKPWMWYLLRFAGTFNLLAGFSMLAFYHEGYKMLGVEKPDLVMPLQLVGVLVALFGIGYHLVAANPVENRNLLMLGFLSKFLGSVLGIIYVLKGQLPPQFFAMLFFADIVYLPPFLIIMRRLYRIAASNSDRENRNVSRVAQTRVSVR
jgi:hypothetical protein